MKLLRRIKALWQLSGMEIAGDSHVAERREGSSQLLLRPRSTLAKAQIIKARKADIIDEINADQAI